MRAELALAVLALSAPRPSPRQLAIDTVLLAAKIAGAERVAWWRWTVWMAAAITIRRIEAA